MMLQLIDRKLKIFFYLILFILLINQITKNKNISRTFIIINNEKRKETCEKKFI